MGKLSDEEARIEAAYLPRALMIVKSMWANYAVENIALVIRVKTGWKAADSRLVYALKRRLDRGQG